MPLLREILLALTIAVGVAALVLLVVGWRRRQRRQLDLPALPSAPAAAEGRLLAAKYVATTTAGDPYDRIAARGLGFRGSATVEVRPDGLRIARRGEAELWLATNALERVDRATWTIDRVVEGDGLHVIRWRLGSHALDTYLRLDDPVAFDAALAELELIAS